MIVIVLIAGIGVLGYIGVLESLLDVLVRVFPYA